MPLSLYNTLQHPILAEVLLPLYNQVLALMPGQHVQHSAGAPLRPSLACLCASFPCMLYQGALLVRSPACLRPDYTSRFIFQVGPASILLGFPLFHPDLIPDAGTRSRTAPQALTAALGPSWCSSLQQPLQPAHCSSPTGCLCATAHSTLCFACMAPPNLPR